jgi:hypothetical protein
MRHWPMLAIATIVFLTACGGNSSSPNEPPGNEGETYEEEIVETKPAQSVIDLLSDDKLSDKKPVFDAGIVDTRPLGSRRDDFWQLNASGAVIGLDIEDIGDDEGFDRLYSSFAAAAKALGQNRILPSVNMIDGKAKQFDDGLYAALDLWQTDNTLEGVRDTRELCTTLLKVESLPDEARWFLEAALAVGFRPDEGDAPLPALPKPVIEHVRRFEMDATQSKPVGFYTWNEELKRCFKFLRFLQQGFEKQEWTLAHSLANAIQVNEQARQQYARMLSFYASLTNPFAAPTLRDVTQHPDKSLDEIWKLKGLPESKPPTVHFLPYSTSRELELFNRLFPSGLPDSADLMLEFVKAVRSGKVDLKPRVNSGWYDYQIYALETFLLPERGSENSKLLLTKKYKQRMLEAFKALVTKRRETHVRQLAGGAGSAAPPTEVAPRLRVEPNPTFYLRTARAYAFLETFLTDWVEGPGASPMHGKREGGNRPVALRDELKSMRDFFYGLHLISCEDIGMKDELLEGEVAERGECYLLAARWADQWYEGGTAIDDPTGSPAERKEALWRSDFDLAVDTRVAVPMYTNPLSIRCWGTLGVRPVKLRAWYATPPKIREIDEKGAPKGDWGSISEDLLKESHYIILTDEFGEFALKGNRVLNRAEFRDFCDRGKTKRDILSALNR